MNVDLEKSKLAKVPVTERKNAVSKAKNYKSYQRSVSLAKRDDTYGKSVEDQTRETLKLSWILWFEGDQPAYLLMVISCRRPP